MASITEAGILTAALLPHFFYRYFMTASAVSTLYTHCDIGRAATRSSGVTAGGL